MKLKWFWILTALVSLWAASVGLYSIAILAGFERPGTAILRERPPQSPEVGQILDSWRGVPVRHNGKPYWRSVGSHSSESGYYYGKQWQCVEYIKRFYFDALGHEMPDVMGHAKSFFDAEVPQGALNVKRDLLQFVNGGDVPPQIDDLMVWQNDTYGHVAIVSKVLENEVEVIQQNVLSGTRERLPLTKTKDGGYFVGDGKWSPAGWLRLPGLAVTE